MAAVFCNNGELVVLAKAFNESPQPSYWMHLFVNDRTPASSDADDASDYTEASFDGYEPVELVDWSIPESVAGVAQTTAAEAEFIAGGSFSGPVDIYGYYVTADEAGTELLWAERFDAAPYTFTAIGQTRRISSTVTLQTVEPA